MENVIEIDGIVVSLCVQCKHHQIIPDPDPNDWFNDDDVAIICTLSKKPEKDLEPNSKFCADRQEFKSVTVSCRPYNVKLESQIPDWCPLLEKK